MMHILTASGDRIIVDDSDHLALSMMTWHISSNGYAMTKIRTHAGPKNTGIHRVIMGLSYGDGLEVDHINGDKLDNRRLNLRVCTTSENGRNRGSTRLNRSGLKGIAYDPERGKFMAKIQVAGKQKNLGRYSTAEEAHAAYKAAAEKLHGQYANTGLIPRGSML